MRIGHQNTPLKETTPSSPPHMRPYPLAKKVGVEKVIFLDPVDVVEVVQLDQKDLLPSLKSRVAVELLNKDPHVHKKAGWQPVFRFAQDLEADIDKMFVNPEVLNRLDSTGIISLMTTLNKIGMGLLWVEDQRRNKLKDTFAVFNPGYESEIKAYETTYARLNTAVRALNPLYYEKLKHEEKPSAPMAPIQKTQLICQDSPVHTAPKGPVLSEHLPDFSQARSKLLLMPPIETDDLSDFEDPIVLEDHGDDGTSHS